MKTYKNLGKYLKEAREKVGVTQRGLAEELKVHGQFVSNWERGICGPPVHAFEALTKLLKLDRKKLVEVMLKDSRMEIESKILIVAAKRKR